MYQVIGVTIIIIGLIFLVHGVNAIRGRVKMKENDIHARLYVGIRAILVGIGSVFLGSVIFMTY